MKRHVRVLGVLAGLVALSVASLPAQAAGGHHAVDDAAVLEAGKCKLEGWAEREMGGARTLYHAGTGCRVGPVELGLNLDRENQAGLDAAISFGPQVKWVYPIHEAVSVGAVASLKFSSQSPRYAGSTLVLPLTWRVTDALSAHANWGRNFVQGGAGQPRGGVALEWAPASSTSLVAERFREAGNNSTRLGVRYALTPDIKLDLSRASSLHTGGVSWWTAGLLWEFEK